MTRPRPARGAALLVAMVLLSVVATLAAGMVWQQWRAVQVETAERSRHQSGWMLLGALDWARLILREDSMSLGERVKDAFYKHRLEGRWLGEEVEPGGLWTREIE